MTERDVRTRYLEVIGTGYVHTQVVLDGATLSDERDNLDDAGPTREITYEEAMAKPAELRCRRCFPIEVPPA